MYEPTPGLEGTLTTNELLAQIDATFGIKYNASTIRVWVGRADDPLPVAYKGKGGQAHRFRWLDFLEWYDSEQSRQSALHDADLEQSCASIDQLDYHSAKTVSAREKAKQDRIETAKLEGRYGEVSEMAKIAEDRARQAQTALMALPSKIAPLLAAESDEIKVYNLLADAIRVVCQHIADVAAADLDSDDPLADAPAE